MMPTASDISNTWSGEISELTLIGQHDHVLLYKAKQYGRWYVFKTIKDGTDDQKHRLQKEFALGVQLDHPHIVRTLDYGHSEQLGDYIRMEWIDGTTLTDFMATHPNRTTRKRLVVQLIEALGYMHDHQMVHRDLKPSNVLITRNGQQLKLIDFGLSNTDDYAAFSQPAGTLSYMAPEQMTALQTDIRSDIYALGKLIKLIAPFYTHISRKCARKKPKGRYASCEKVLQAIRHQQRAKIWIPVSLLFALLIALTSYFCYMAFFLPDPREAIIQQAKELVAEQYELICGPKEQIEISPQEHSETILLFYTRCSEIRDSIATTIEDAGLRNDFINTMVIESGQRAAQFKKD